MKFCLTIILAALTNSAFATLNVNLVPNEGVVRHEVGNGRDAEYCFVPMHLPGGDYRKKDRRQEEELCQMNIGVNIAVCGKMESTNPGLNFYLPEDSEKMSSEDLNKRIAELQANSCRVKDIKKELDKEAKYKLSTSCSYSPAIISYYHMSRALGDIVNVPPVVLRTVDFNRHIAIAKKTESLLPDGTLIDTTFRGLITQMETGQAGQNSKARDNLLTNDLKQTYGALLKNAKHEEKYQKEFFNGGADEQRVEEFKENNAIYLELSASDLQIGSEFTQANVQKMVQLKDAADFILLDTILGQKDRFGNIHYFVRYYYKGVNKQGAFDVKSEKDKEDVPADVAVLEIKEMLLKDNDCGVGKENLILKHRLLDNIKHMSPKTYRKLQELAKIFDTADVKNQFILGYNYTADQFKTVSGNLQTVAKDLKQRCLAKKLKLDLSLDVHFSPEAKPSGDQCEI